MAETCWSTHIVSDMTLSAGSRVHSDYLDVREPVFEGLQVIVSVSYTHLTLPTICSV